MSLIWSVRLTSCAASIRSDETGPARASDQRTPGRGDCCQGDGPCSDRHPPPYPRPSPAPWRWIRTLRVTRAGAVKARTQAFNTLFGVMIGAPSPLRGELVALTKRTLVNGCLQLRPETDGLLVLQNSPTGN